MSSLGTDLQSPWQVGLGEQRWLSDKESCEVWIEHGCVRKKFAYFGRIFTFLNEAGGANE